MHVPRRFEASSRNYLRGVRVPLFVMQAIDDPMLDHPSWVDEHDIGDATVRGIVTLEARLMTLHI